MSMNRADVAGSSVTSPSAVVIYGDSPLALTELTGRQWQVLQLLSSGLRPGQVAVQLRSREKTVNSYRMAILVPVWG